MTSENSSGNIMNNEEVMKKFLHQTEAPKKLD